MMIMRSIPSKKSYINNLCISKFGSTFFKECSSLANEDYTEVPQYPPIFDTTENGIKQSKRRELHEKYKTLQTVEEKLLAMNLPKYYGWNSLILSEGNHPYGCLPFVRQITRTNLKEIDNTSLKQLWPNISQEEIKNLCESIRPNLQEVLLYEIKGKRRSYELGETGSLLSDSELSDLKSSEIVEQINNTITSHLSSSYSHILESSVDFKPRLESFWLVGGFNKSEEIVKEEEKNKESFSGSNEEPIEYWIQYFGKPCIQIRNNNPLTELDFEAIKDLNAESKVPFNYEKKYDPKVAYGLTFQRRHGTNIPGFWPGDRNEFGLLSYHTQGHLLDRPPHFGSEDAMETLHAQGILASFAWLHAQAMYQGFTTFNEITYPFTAQTIITDGCSFSFYIYQLNTILLHNDFISNNPRMNTCLALPSKKLFQNIVNNKFEGWDDDVFSSILMCYLNKPKERIGVVMKPYVSSEKSYVANIEDEKRREWLHKQFRHMYSNRPRHFLPYEIYDWERIYKIEFETRPFEARLRPFELDANPLEERKYYEHMPPYIPRKFRPKKRPWNGWRGKYEKKYYPQI